MTAMNTLSKEQSKILAGILDRKYGSHLGNRYFDVESRNEGAVVLIKVTLRDAKGTFLYPVEARMNTEEQDLSVSEARDLMLDYIDAYFEEFLSSGEDTYLTIDWSDYECDGFDLQMRGQIFNEHLDKLADDLLEGRKLDLGKLSGKILH